MTKCSSFGTRGVDLRPPRRPTTASGERPWRETALRSLVPSHRMGAVRMAATLAALSIAPAPWGQSVASSGAPPAPAESAATRSRADVQDTSRASFLAAVRNSQEVLYPGDIVRLKIWREPDLSGDYDVNAQGIATFPKVGAVRVTDITTDSLQRLLIATYSEYLRDPAIEVTPLRRVTVLGAVKNPGLYPVDPTMSIADAVALAGGPTPDGNQKKVELIRGNKKKNVTVTAHTQVASTQLRSGDELYVPERSWLSRNGYIVGAAIGAAAVITTTIIANGA